MEDRRRRIRGVFFWFGWWLFLCQAAACGPEHPATESWTVQVMQTTPLLIPSAGGCLQPSASGFPPGTLTDVLASDGRFVLIDEQGTCLRAADVVEVSRPNPLSPSLRKGVVQIGSQRWTYDESGCLAAAEELPEQTQVYALARFHDQNYRGFVVLDQSLGLAPVRHVDAEGWDYPWHASVQVMKPVPEGLVIGGGILVDATHLLTASHMQLDQTWCYSREANGREAWEAGRAMCGNISGPAQNHPDGVDVAIATLTQPEPPPHAQVRTEFLSQGEAFYSSNFSQMHTHAFSDSTVRQLSFQNAFCQNWPNQTTFFSSDRIIGPGDSGGPAFVGDQLVGIVHGERCQYPGQRTEHVFVHLPGVYDFIQTVLAPNGTY